MAGSCDHVENMPEPGAAKLLFEAGLDCIELDMHYK